MPKSADFNIQNYFIYFTKHVLANKFVLKKFQAMWLMLQQDKPEDFVIASGETHSVREFVEASFKHVGKEIVWEGKGVDEVGKEKDTGKIRVKVNQKYFRPTEVVSIKYIIIILLLLVNIAYNIFNYSLFLIDSSQDIYCYSSIVLLA